MKRIVVGCIIAVTLAVAFSARPAEISLQAGQGAQARKVRAGCEAYSTQLDSDLEAMRRQQATNKLGMSELEEWTKQNEEAQVKALQAGVQALTGGVADKLIRKIDTLRLFRQQQNNILKNKIPGVDPKRLGEMLDASIRQYNAARRIAQIGGIFKAGGTLVDVWSLVQAEFSAVARELEQADENVRAALSNPEVREQITSNTATRDFAAELFSATANADDMIFGKVLGPATSLAKFVVDYGYETTRWMESRDRILQQYKLADEQLKAVDALKQQIECTTRKLQDCNLGKPVKSCDGYRMEKVEQYVSNLKAPPLPPAPKPTKDQQPPKKGGAGKTVGAIAAAGGGAVAAGILAGKLASTTTTSIRTTTSTVRSTTTSTSVRSTTTTASSSLRCSTRNCVVSAISGNCDCVGSVNTVCPSNNIQRTVGGTCFGGSGLYCDVNLSCNNGRCERDFSQGGRCRFP